MDATKEAGLADRQLFIGNESVTPHSGRYFTTVNPATEEAIAQVASGDSEDADRAVQAAHAALSSKDWAGMDACDRGRLIGKIADLLEAHTEEVAHLETIDNGKPIFESQYVDIPLCVNILRYYAGWADKIQGTTIPVRGGHLAYTRREPVGVVGAITPWNFPLLLAVWKIGPALATGCTMVLKPAELTSLTALRFAELCAEAGLPAGVLNVVTGRGSVVGQALVEHPLVDKIAFTGSTEVGKRIMQTAAAGMKRVSLELGGKSPNIVFADCDIEAAIRGAHNGIFYGKGEVCAAGSRLFVEESVHDAVMEGLVARAQRAVPADPLHPKTRMGAIVSEAQQKTVLGYIDKGKAEGAKLATGGEAVKVNDRGFFVQPTIFDQVTPAMTIAREEIFGPVLSVIPFKDQEDAIRMANDTTYGLAAAVWTKDITRAHSVAARIKAGTVWINMINTYDAAAPFGGFKESGFGRELGEKALDAYTETKTVWVNLKG
jgi:aldehyde dehydrogenase (NAD+)